MKKTPKKQPALKTATTPKTGTAEIHPILRRPIERDGEIVFPGARSIKDRIGRVMTQLTLIASANNEDTVFDSVDLLNAIREIATDAHNDLYWVARLPLVKSLPAPTDDQLMDHGGSASDSTIDRVMREAMAHLIGVDPAGVTVKKPKGYEDLTPQSQRAVDAYVDLLSGMWSAR